MTLATRRPTRSGRSDARRAHGFEVALTDLVARRLWRYLRPFVARHLSKRCRRCVVSERQATLDEGGLCPDCAAEGPGAAHLDGAAAATKDADPGLREQLDELLRSIVGTSTGRYDVLVLISGGKDSAYMLHRVLGEHPRLRVLGLLVDNGFMSPFAMENAAHVVEALGVPFLRLRLPPEVVRHTFRYALAHLDQQRGYSVVDLADGIMTFDSAMDLASGLGIPAVLCGLGSVQTKAVFGGVGIELTVERYREAIEQQLDVGWDCITGTGRDSALHDPRRWGSSRRPQMILPLCAWDPSEDQLLAEVDRLGLVSAARSHPLVTNNALVPVSGMAEVARFGYCSWETEFASMIRSGKSDRRYWLNLFEMLEYSTKTGRFVNRTVTQSLQRLGLTKADVGIGTGRS